MQAVIVRMLELMMVVIGDDAGDDDEYEYDGGEDCGDDGGLVQDWCKQSGEQPVQAGSPTSPNFNSTTLSSPASSSASVAPNFYELGFPHPAIDIKLD